MARENTEFSFRAALDAGAHGVELDVHLTRDGVPVVHHDPSGRCDGRDTLLDGVDWPVLKLMDFQAQGAVYRIPSLDHILKALGPGALVNVEIKAPASGLSPESVARILAVTAGLPQVLVSSFSIQVLRSAAEVDPGLPLAFLFEDPRELDALPSSLPLFAWHPGHRAVDGSLITRARRRGLRLHAWTVDDPARGRDLIAAGADALITNRPDLLAPVCAG